MAVTVHNGQVTGEELIDEIVDIISSGLPRLPPDDPAKGPLETLLPLRSRRRARVGAPARTATAPPAGRRVGFLTVYEGGVGESALTGRTLLGEIADLLAARLPQVPLTDSSRPTFTRILMKLSSCLERPSPLRPLSAEGAA